MKLITIIKATFLGGALTGAISYAVTTGVAKGIYRKIQKHREKILTTYRYPDRNSVEGEKQNGT